MRFLGVDPGLRITGYACVDGLGEFPALIEAGVIRLRDARSEADERRSLSQRLLELHEDIAAIIERLRPEVVCVEELFAHYKHPATAIAMAHARGVILLAAARTGLTLREFKPTLVKKSLTGNGHAPKPQMQAAVQAVFRLERAPEPADVADAIAIALAGSRRHGMLGVR